MNVKSAFSFHLEDDSFSAVFELADRQLAFLKHRRAQMRLNRATDAQWAILLALFAAARDDTPVSTMNLVPLAGVPLSTLLRYLAQLEEEGLIRRDWTEHDRRVTFVHATTAGIATVAGVLASAPESAR